MEPMLLRSTTTLLALTVNIAAKKRAADQNAVSGRGGSQEVCGRAIRCKRRVCEHQQNCKGKGIDLKRPANHARHHVVLMRFSDFGLVETA